MELRSLKGCWRKGLLEVDNKQFDFMPGRGTTDAHFIVSSIQEEYSEKNKKLYMCFMDLEKAFD